MFLIFWCVFVFQGTEFNQLFSRKKLVFVSVFGLIDLISSAYIAYLLYNNQESIDKSFEKFKINPDLEIIYIMNSICTLYIYTIFLYYGFFKKSIKTYTLKEINYLE